MESVADVIAVKRDGGVLSEEVLTDIAAGLVQGAVGEAQAGALLMAIAIHGLDDAETKALARALVASGKRLDLGLVRRPVLDAHGTPGVGDKSLLVLGPVIAACGGVFATMADRALGHCGGTLDKLEALSGFRVQLPQGEFVRQLERIGLAVIGPSERVVPADLVLQALRDVTATAADPGLIAASLMARAIAVGGQHLVVTVKYGRGAFAADLDGARRVGRLCTAIGDDFERPVTCLYQRHDEPLGSTIGARLEVEEAWQVLGGGGPADVRELVLEQAAALLPQAGLGLDGEAARAAAEAALDDGRAAEQFERWCYVQGARFKPGEFHLLAGEEIVAPAGGYVQTVDALQVGRGARLAATARASGGLDPAAGVFLRCLRGDQVAAGEPLATVFSRETARRRAAAALVESAYVIAEAPPSPRSLLCETE